MPWSSRSASPRAATTSSSGGGGGGGGSKEAKLAFVYPTTTTNFAQEMALGAKAAADATARREAHGVRARRGQRAEAGAAVPGRDAHVEGRRGDDDADARPVPAAAADREPQNVPLVAVDVPPPKGAEKAVKLLIGNSNEEIGADLAKALLPKIPEGAKGEILIGTDTPGLPVLEQRNKGFKDVMKKERPGRELPRLRRQAEPDRQLQHLERAGQGAP